MEQKIEQILGKSKNLIGMKFNHLTVKSLAYKKSRLAYWNCECDCGSNINVITNSYNLKSGHTKSCGCAKNYRNHYEKSVCGIGYIGEGDYKTTLKNKKHTIEYSIWRDMLRRCYDKERLKKFPTYKGCTVCEEWLCFQNFAKWHSNNYYELNNEKMCLDKDILYKGNKIYSSKTSMFVPDRINTLFIKSIGSRGLYPIGVTKDKRYLNRYRARCSIVENNKIKRKYLGEYSTPEKAFEVYKEFKEQYIKQIADEYKNKYPQFPQRLYNAMYNYKVEITD